MAKRKRLTPAQPGYLTPAQSGNPDGARAPETKSMPLGNSVANSAGISAPIAHVVGDASARAALDELSGVLREARDEGRIIDLLPLGAIDDSYLVRDRMEQDEDDMAALMASIAARGQQTPIEVIRLPEPAGGMTHGLISGWRRLTALRRLCKGRSDSEFARIRALVIAPESAQDAYVAMVEENEIRVNLSFYERARIALRAVREGVYPTPRAALQALYISTSRSRRSKIGTFVTVVAAFDRVLKFPTAIPEKLGLSLARAIQRDPEFVARVTQQLRAAAPTAAAQEVQVLSAALDPDPEPALPPHKAPAVRQSAPSVVQVQARSGISLRFTPEKRRIELSGPQVDAALCDALQDWLKNR
jgi:ParB family transcriptional regulator, chromosome partitioning protein